VVATAQTAPPLCQNGNEIPKGALSCLPVGIYPDAQASQVWAWTFEVTNDYAGVYEGQYIQVYAGAVMAPPYNAVDTPHGTPDGGGVRVSTDNAATYQQFLAPDTSGSLSIKAVVELW
jgi:hypothetical protein